MSPASLSGSIADRLRRIKPPFGQLLNRTLSDIEWDIQYWPPWPIHTLYPPEEAKAE